MFLADPDLAEYLELSGFMGPFSPFLNFQWLELFKFSTTLARL